uniref:Pectate lyase n=1 Tax=viral metagenome TaxID=1070528 RepID=A0A6M3JBG2_9ZZZZ
MLNISGIKLPMIGNHLVGGNVYFVDSGGDGASNNNDGLHPSRALATLDGGINKCTDNNGDFVVLLPGHAESVSTTIALDVAGIKILGIGHGTLRPNLTQATSGSSGVITISSSNVEIENIYFTGSATGTNERFLIISTKSQNNITVKNCVFEQKSKNLDAVTIVGVTNAVAVEYISAIRFEGCKFVGTAAGPDTGINIVPMASHCAKDISIVGCHFDYLDSAGIDDGCIAVSLSGGATCTSLLIDNCTAMGIADGEQFIYLSPGAGTTGLVSNCRVSTADATDAVIISNLLSFCGLQLAEPGKSAAVTKTLHPIATPAA